MMGTPRTYSIDNTSTTSKRRSTSKVLSAVHDINGFHITTNLHICLHLMLLCPDDHWWKITSIRCYSSNSCRILHSPAIAPLQSDSLQHFFHDHVIPPTGRTHRVLSKCRPLSRGTLYSFGGIFWISFSLSFVNSFTFTWVFICSLIWEHLCDSRHLNYQKRHKYHNINIIQFMSLNEWHVSPI